MEADWNPGDSGHDMDNKLRSALDDGDLDRVRSLVLLGAAESRAQVGLGAESELTTLQLAALHDQETAQALLDRGTECDLHSACALGMTKRIASAAQAELDTFAEWLTPMGFALIRGNYDAVQALLRAGDDPNRPLPRIGFFVWEVEAMTGGHGPWMPIHSASTHGYADDARRIVQRLIKGGARVDAPSPLGAQAIHLAAIYGWLPVLSTLLDRGADVNARTREMSDTVWRLSAPANAQRAHRQTPLMIAAQEGTTAAAQLLLERGATVGLRDSSGSTALHAAASAWWNENTEFVSLLLEAGGDPRARNVRDRTPHDLAIAAGYTASAALLAG